MSGFYTKLPFYLVYIRDISLPRTYGKLHNKGPYLSKPKEASLRSRTGNTKARNAEPLANKYFNSYIGERIRT